MADTVKLASVATKPMNSDADTSNRIFLAENLVFKGQFDSYEILADKRIAQGGESQVFLARRISDEVILVAKIYDEFPDTYASKQNRKMTLDFLSKNTSNKAGNKRYLLPYVDYGNIALTGDDGEILNKPIDILPYCEDGELKQADYIYLKNEIIPSVLNALNLMHTSNKVHRDLKPGNLYKYEGDIVVADFGTVCSVNSGAGFAGTSQRRGTLGYTAPEVWQGYASIASDYYSFGCTIAALYKGEHVYQNLINLSEEAAINRVINSGGLPLDCPDNEKDLQTLVDALTIADETKRAGYDDVVLWLDDSVAFEQKFRNSRLGAADFAFEFNFENVTYRSEGELVKALASNWEIAKPYLYRGGVKNSTLVNYFSKVNPTVAIRLGDIIEGKDTATNYDLGLAMALHHIVNGGPLYWKGMIYEKLTDISSAMSSNSLHCEELEAMLKTKYISWKLENSSGAAPETVEAVKQIESLADDFSALAVYYAKHLFSSELSKQTYKGAETPDDIFRTLTKTPKDFYQSCDELIKSSDEFLGFIAFKGFADNALNFRKSLTGKVSSDMELLYRLFEAVCADKKAVRKHYYQYGPQSHLYWLQQNLDLYDFHTNKAKEIRNNITGIKFSSVNTIDELSRKFMKLGEYQKDFLSVFQGNIHLAYLGITDKDKNDITTLNPNAFYLETFCETTVPVGYQKYIQSNRKAS